MTVDKQVHITVDGGYSPDVIQVKRGQPVTLQFLRRDPSSCLEEVVLPDFGVRERLPLNLETAAARYKIEILGPLPEWPGNP